MPRTTVWERGAEAEVRPEVVQVEAEEEMVETRANSAAQAWTAIAVYAAAEAVTTNVAETTRTNSN